MKYYLCNGIPTSFKEVGPLTDDDVETCKRNLYLTRTNQVSELAVTGKAQQAFNALLTLLSGKPDED